MAQRFGRVNRFGKCKDTEIIVVYREDLQADYNEGLEKAKSAKKDPDKKVAAYERKKQADLRIINTLELLKELGDSASPAALDALPEVKRAAAFSPAPELRVATDIQFDAWALTSIRHPIAARPPVTPYLHGEAEWQPPETQVAWREELDVLKTDELRNAHPPADILEDFPLKPHELLRETSERVYDRLVIILRKRQTNGATLPSAWLIRENGDTEVFPLARLISDQETESDNDNGEENEDDTAGNTNDTKKAEKARKNRAVAALANATLILPESLGGIDKKGLLTPNATGDDAGKADVADIEGQRIRVWSPTRDVPADRTAAGFRLIRSIDTKRAEENLDDSGESANRYWLWLEAKFGGATAAPANRTARETLIEHTAAVTANAVAIAAKFFPTVPSSPNGEPDLRRCIVVAARVHDLGKNRARWQRNLGNLAYGPAEPNTILAKSAPGMQPRNVAEYYRHEFGSLNDSSGDVEFAALNDTERDIVLHIVAAHHGRARPHFPVAEIGDYADNAAASDANVVLAIETPRRFARLQKRFGRWGLAWLESLLRAADYAASAGLIAPTLSSPAGNDYTAASSTAERSPVAAPKAQYAPTATLAVNPANPGHYFACCGLIELAARLSPSALAWFEQDTVTREWRFHLANTPPLTDLLKKITAAEIIALHSDDRAKSALEIRLPNTKTHLHLDWWRHEGGAIGKLKPWAGNTSVRDIADDMRQALKNELVANAAASVEFILSSMSTANNGEPFYFDANRAVNARAQDVGFSADKLRKGGIRISTNTAPAVELLALVGLQRARPPLTVNERGREREYDYHVWHKPLPIALLAAAVPGLLPDTTVGFRFANPSRAKDYRAFAPAASIS